MQALVVRAIDLTHSARAHLLDDSELSQLAADHQLISTPKRYATAGWKYSGWP